MKTSQLFGVWNLIEFANFSAAATRIPWTGQLSGRLIYASPNIVSVAINRRQTQAEGSVVEHASFYAGRFEFVDENTVVHRVEQSSDWNRIGDRYLRTITLTGDRLEIHGSGQTGRVHLVWIREPTP